MPTLKIQKADGTFEFLQLAGEEFADIGHQVLDVKSQLAQITTNVKRFKCDDGEYVKGNGVHDDTSGIQRAIDALYSSDIQGGVLFFPKGVYRITKAIYQKPRVSFKGEGSRKSTIRYHGLVTDLKYKSMVYCVEGTDQNPEFVFSTNIEGITISGGGIALNALGIRGHQENCRFSDLVLSGFTENGLEVMPFSSVNHGISFEDIHIIPQAGAIGATGLKGSHVQKCNFKNITTDMANGHYYDKGIHLYNTPLLNVFENIHTEDCVYGFYIEGGANNIYISLEALNHQGNGIAHFYTTATRYQILGIRTVGGYARQLDDGTNTINATNATDSLTIIRGGNTFKRVADTITERSTINGVRLTRGVDACAGLTGVGQSYLRTNGTIGISETKFVEIELDVGSVGFSGVVKIFGTGAQRFIATAYFEGHINSSGVVSGGATSENEGSPNKTRVTIGNPVALSPETAGKFRIPIVNNSVSFTQTIEVMIEMSANGQQAKGIVLK